MMVSSITQSDPDQESDLAQLSLGDLVAVASAQPVLEAADEDSLVKRAQLGDAEASEQLVLRNLRIAIDEAIRTRGLGLPQRELVPTGVRTLLDAIRSYDPLADGPFSSHVRARVRRAMRAIISIS
jgi:DNA-directed RNA polymerase sigma subunit (sigma70/sigma32)